MKLQITHLKAPWPDGANVGDVVEFTKLDEVPAWAVGKCLRAEAGAKVSLAATVPVKTPPDPAADLTKQMNQADASIVALKAEHAEELKRLRDDNEAGGRALQEALDENERLRAQLAARETDDAKAAAALQRAEDQAAAEKAAREAKAGRPARP